MNFRRLIFSALMLVFAWQVAAITIDELQELNYSVYDSTAVDFPAQAALFLEEHDSLSDLDYAAGMWSSIDSLGYRTFIENKINSQIDVPKYRYLLIGLENDPQQKVLLARSLINDFPDYSNGYHALVVTYLRDFYPDELNQEGSAANLMLEEDLPLFAGFGLEFPEDDFARLALIYYYVRNHNTIDAKPLLQEAVANEEAWLENYDLARLLPMEDFHELQAYLLELFKEKGAEYLTFYTVPDRAGDLLAYYFEAKRDYQAVIDFFGPDPFFWGSQYIIYGLTMSYYNLEDLSSSIPLLTYDGDVAQARAFQDSWLAFDPAQANTVYTDVLGKSAKDALQSYLSARVLGLDTEKIAKGRALIKNFPKEEYGYRLLTDVYLNYFGTSAIDDSLRSKMISSLDKDIKALRKFESLFPAELHSSLANLLWSIRKKNDSQALETYKTLDLASSEDDLSSKVYKIIIDFNRLDLLLQIKAFEAKNMVEKGYIAAEDELKYTVMPYCETIYTNGYYSMMLEEIAKKPTWMEITDLQFLIVNTHYEQGDLDKTIAMLRYMVEKGSIGTSTLITVEDEALTTHPDWQPLLDYAATMPDPGVSTQ